MCWSSLAIIIMESLLLGCIADQPVVTDDMLKLKLKLKLKCTAGEDHLRSAKGNEEWERARWTTMSDEEHSMT
jgi:hypothetical protein